MKIASHEKPAYVKSEMDSPCMSSLLRCWQLRTVDDEMPHSHRRAVSLLRQVGHLLRAALRRPRPRRRDVDWIDRWRRAWRGRRHRRSTGRRLHSADTVATARPRPLAVVLLKETVTITIRLRFDCSSTALRPFNDLRHDRPGCCTAT